MPPRSWIPFIGPLRVNPNTTAELGLTSQFTATARGESPIAKDIIATSRLREHTLTKVAVDHPGV
jgi:hypothetical protein